LQLSEFTDLGVFACILFCFGAVLLLLYLLLFWSCNSLVGAFLGWFFWLLLVDVGRFFFFWFDRIKL
jgi:hypothetical protein